MIKYKNQNNNNSIIHSGFTLMEMLTAILLFVIVVLAASGVLSDSQHSWNLMYNRTFSEVVTAGHIAKRAFEATVRKSSNSGLSIDGAGKWVEVHYYDDDTSTFLDCYSLFYHSGTKLYVERGWLNPNNPSNPRGTLSTSIICENVSNCIFKRSGKYVYLMITLNDGTQNLVIGSSAIMHNI
jgi:prepilin-type N-terminal cleavage/methylation domain-containing protein